MDKHNRTFLLPDSRISWQVFGILISLGFFFAHHQRHSSWVSPALLFLYLCMHYYGGGWCPWIFDITSTLPDCAKWCDEMKTGYPHNSLTTWFLLTTFIIIISHLISGKMWEGSQGGKNKVWISLSNTLTSGARSGERRKMGTLLCTTYSRQKPLASISTKIVIIYTCNFFVISSSREKLLCEKWTCFPYIN